MRRLATGTMTLVYGTELYTAAKPRGERLSVGHTQQGRRRRRQRPHR